MAFTKKIRDASGPLSVGKDNLVTLWNIDVNALLMSQAHFRLKSGGWSGGGEFYQASSKTIHSTQSLSWLRNGSTWNGTAAGAAKLATSGLAASQALVPTPNLNSIVASFGGIDAQREALQNKADFTAGWERTRPGNPVASLAQFIAELRDFPLIPGSQVGKAFLKRVNPPSVSRYRSSFLRSWISGPVEQIPWKLQMQLGIFKALGSEYLNHVFGWAPFVSDLQKLYVLSQTIDNRIKQLARDNGRGIRRKAKLGNDQQTASKTLTDTLFPFYGALQAPPSWAAGGSTWQTVSKTERKSWYSARYRYYIPDVGSGSWIPKARRALYGGTITPSLVWELTPWSWLIDWFGNVGSVLSNFSENAVSDLVADYAFCMIHTKTTTTATSTGSWRSVINQNPDGSPNSRIMAGSHNLSSTYTTETKVRIRGSPYGLGVKFSSLSGRQLGVLAALGITKSSF